MLLLPPAAADVPDQPRPPGGAVASPELLAVSLVGACEVERVPDSGEQIGPEIAPQQSRSVRRAVGPEQGSRLFVPNEVEGSADVRELRVEAVALGGDPDGSDGDRPGLGALASPQLAVRVVADR